MVDFTICVLLYGDYPNLARRCLSSIARLPRDRFQLRLGCNAVSAATMDYVHQQTWINACIQSEKNIFKYPMMRRLFHGFGPITTPYVMWFDDDSYLRHPVDDTWLDQVTKAIKQAHMIGSIYQIGLRASQIQWITKQSWYGGRPIAMFGKKHQPGVAFATGGWWTIRSEVLRRYDWPIPELSHRGGDVMLGELFHQQELQLAKFNTGVAINADDQGRESKAPRRGHDEPPIGCINPREQ